MYAILLILYIYLTNNLCNNMINIDDRKLKTNIKYLI